MINHPLIRAYLIEVEKALSDQNWKRKNQIIRQIREDIDNRISESEIEICDLNYVDIERLLNKYGDPIEIANDYKVNYQGSNEKIFKKYKKAVIITSFSIISLIMALTIIAGIILANIPHKNPREFDLSLEYNVIVGGYFRIGDMEENEKITISWKFSNDSTDQFEIAPNGLPYVNLNFRLTVDDDHGSGNQYDFENINVNNPKGKMDFVTIQGWYFLRIQLTVNNCTSKYENTSVKINAKIEYQSLLENILP